MFSYLLIMYTLLCIKGFLTNKYKGYYIHYIKNLVMESILIS